MQSALKGRQGLYATPAPASTSNAPRRITITASRRGRHLRLVLDVACSKGTYIRTLAEEIGETLGCGAHLAALRRTGSGPLAIADAITLDALAALDEAARDAILLPPDVLLADWTALRLAADEAGRFLTGLRRRVDAPDNQRVRVYGPEPKALLGAAHICAGELIPDRLLSPAELQGLLDS
jgi:tRNA pseudouridine55 synthase